ncbi:MAG TPA: bifunctional phosphopantothenoylcysteine decarboxylase/phosphopantothenate--cysteine ligase CoaBC [Balneolaceae bacterium]|nr:bifunctional phosphopantothenoylcysteine decarboxylase/phosphopantothenate--cysteine ligase CoaBC [Balneolaceae bacterium]
MLTGKRIILGVTGGIAAYKAAYLLRSFQKQGADVRVTMTPSATKFVGVETFSALSRHTVATEVFTDNKQDDSWTKHIHWGEWADLFVIAPCTANTLAKLVTGQSDNMLTSTALAARCPLLICPTMDGEMYEHATVQNNLKKAEELGYYTLEPDSGYLASGLDARGRLPEDDVILQKSSEIIQQHQIKGPLTGKKVIVTAGPTREFLDPVRFLSNPSSGKMGLAMAEAARTLGADVELFLGPVSIGVPDRIPAKRFTSADDLLELVKNSKNADIFIMAAAVSDYKPASVSESKIKKTEEHTDLRFENTPDILQWLGDKKQPHQTLIGFAMETDNVIENASKKLEKKNADYICVNQLSNSNTGFGSDKNTITLLAIDKPQKTFSGLKSEIAFEILNTIFPES